MELGRLEITVKDNTSILVGSGIVYNIYEISGNSQLSFDVLSMVLW